MWKPVAKQEESRGLVATTVGELKEILNCIPDNYVLSVVGTRFGILMDEDDEVVLMDEIEYLENLLIDQKESSNEGT